MFSTTWSTVKDEESITTASGSRFQRRGCPRAIVGIPFLNGLPDVTPCFGMPGPHRLLIPASRPRLDIRLEKKISRPLPEKTLVPISRPSATIPPSRLYRA